ncbi:MAG: exonuclease SbcCD subunit D [Lachnospiraceae bacterium]|nr:exonuclease SbcCD subunit D [Lachnospiraceae bacterium]
MKFLHISDLHIGKRVNEFSMIEDQRYILKQILEIADKRQVDGVLIAGDIYDKSVPSAEAVQVFDWFLTELAERKRTVFAVSGNHDSAERIAFGAQIMKGREVYVSPVYNGEIERVRMTDSYGEIWVYLLPFIKPAAVRHVLEGEEGAVLPESYHDAVRTVVERMGVDEKERNILVAHQFVTGAGRCDSEEIAVGGMDQVGAEVFDRFDYVALGHIHSPQWIGRKEVRYCGTPLKYSFSEAEQQKSVTVVTCREKGEVEIEMVELSPIRDMRKVRGSYQEVMAREFYQGKNQEDYVQITLTDEEDVLDGMQRLRAVYPNLMQLLYDNSRTRQSRMVEVGEDIEEKSELELFQEFYRMQNNREMSLEQIAFVERVIEGVRE